MTVMTQTKLFAFSCFRDIIFFARNLILEHSVLLFIRSILISSFVVRKN